MDDGASEGQGARRAPPLTLALASASAAQDEDQAFRKFKLRVEDVQGTNCLTNFWARLPDSPSRPAAPS